MKKEISARNFFRAVKNMEIQIWFDRPFSNGFAELLKIYRPIDQISGINNFIIGTHPFRGIFI